MGSGTGRVGAAGAGTGRVGAVGTGDPGARPARGAAVSPPPGLRPLPALPQRLGLPAPSPFLSRAAASLPFPPSLRPLCCFVFRDGATRGLRKYGQGRRPGRAGGVSGAPHAHPAHAALSGDPGAEPLALPERLSHPKTPGVRPRQPGRPCLRLSEGLNRPAGVLKENPLSPPYNSPPTLPFRACFFLLNETIECLALSFID